MKAIIAFSFAALLALCAGCKKAVGPIDNLLGGQIRVIGHAGVGFESMLSPFPSNSITTIRRAVEGFNADGIEVDVQVTQDSVPVLLHDQTLESMTNCYGNVANYTARELEMCHYRTDFNSHVLQDEHIVKLEEILVRYAGSVFDPWIYLDIKFPKPEYTSQNIEQALIRAVDNLARKYNYVDKLSIASSEINRLLYLRQLNPDIELVYDHDNFEEALQLTEVHKLNGIVIANDNVSKEQVTRAHKKGIQVVIFGVALRKDIVDAVNKHPDVIQTDNVILLQQILSE